jgi:protein-S-isoprenylcysteine O-methyltransferase Ste14
MSGLEPKKKRSYFVFPPFLMMVNFIVIIPAGFGSASFTYELWDFIFVAVGCYLGLRFIRYMSKANEYPESKMHPSDVEEFPSKGIYADIRHPVEAGILYMNIAYVFLFRSISLIPMLPVFFALWYMLAKYKEDLYIKKFGDQYRKYMRITGMFRGKGDRGQTRLASAGYDMY